MAKVKSKQLTLQLTVEDAENILGYWKHIGAEDEENLDIPEKACEAMTELCEALETIIQKEKN